MPLEQKDPEIHFFLDGVTVEIEVFNVTGPACEALSKPYTDMFQITEVKKKAEHAIIAKQSQQQRNKL